MPRILDDAIITYVPTFTYGTGSTTAAPLQGFRDVANRALGGQPTTHPGAQEVSADEYNQLVNTIHGLRKEEKKMAKLPINVITAIDALMEHEEEARIYGSHARGIATKSFTRYDVPHIVSQDPQCIPTLMKICRKLSFVPLVSEAQRRGSKRLPDGAPSLVMLTAKYDEDVGEEEDDSDDTEIFGYLTKADLKDVHGIANLWVPNRKVFVDRLNRDEELDFAPDIADTISKYTHNGMVFFIHLLPKDVSPEDYIKVMTDRSVSFLANNAFFRKGKLSAIDNRSIVDIEKKVIRFKGTAPRQHAAAQELKSQGWVIARSIDPNRPTLKSKVPVAVEVVE